MIVKCHRITNQKELENVLDEYIDKNIQVDRLNKIISKYSGKYPIKGEVATVQGKQICIDYLPTLDLMLEATQIYKKPLEPLEIVGGALFKIDHDYCIFLTDTKDPVLQLVYSANQINANALADKLWKLNTEEFDYQLTNILATVLSDSFAIVFDQTYGNWRRSLTKYG